MIKASIDIGSNTILLLIAQIKDTFEVLENHSTVTSLGLGLDIDGAFTEESMKVSADTLASYVQICKKYNVQAPEIVVTATEASRKAVNANIFFNDLKRSLNLTFKILSGEGEAFYSAQGVLADNKIKEKEIIIMDIGGASTEFIKVNVATKQVVKSVSLPIGAVRATSWIASSTYQDKLKKIKEQLKQNFNIEKNVICVAGTMTSIANILQGNSSYIEDSVHGKELTLKDLDIVQKNLSLLSDEEILLEFPFLGKRFKTIKAGVKLAKDLLETLEVEKISVSIYGLRYGTLVADSIKEKYVESSV